MPITVWYKTYNKSTAFSDITASVIVTLMLIPQALAYGMLAGLPPEIGLYSSMFPLIAYGIFGSSTTLSVGPAAVAALMTAAAIAPFSAISIETGLLAAAILAAISGLILLSGGLLKLGFFANFLSHPVISGFINAASLTIAISQVPTLLGISSSGENMVEMVISIYKNINNTNITVLIMSSLVILSLIANKIFGGKFLKLLGYSQFLVQILTKSFPAILVIVGILLMISNYEWTNNIHVLGEFPEGLPEFGFPSGDLSIWKQLLAPAILITIVGYVESISIAQSLAMRRKERINPDQELLALGVSNIVASFGSGMPVTGGVSRSIVNTEAGAMSPAAGIFTAFGIIIASLTITQFLTNLPKLILSATIVVAILSIIDLSVFRKTLKVSLKDFLALVITFLVTLLLNIEWGLTSGVLISVGFYLYKSCKPHIATVGNIKGTEHFRNQLRYKVDLCPDVFTLRLDESLYFANAKYLEQTIIEVIADNNSIKHLILMCSAINNIDISAIEILESINDELKQLNIGFHLSEVKGPVMDFIDKTDLLEKLNGKVFLTQYKAYEELRCI
jgi:sulfate permease, SulP family